MKWPAEPQRLPADAPNILIVLLDDTGFGVSEVFGGEVETPAFKKLAEEGLALQRVSHHVDLFADTGFAADRTQSYASRIWNDRRTSGCV